VRRATILASVPWFLQDLSTYGIGIFTPTILAATVGHEVTIAHNITAVIARDLLAAKGAALVDILLIVGIAAAVLLTDRVGRIRLQIWGFAGCAVALAMAALSLHAEEPARSFLLFGGFMLFNFMTNMGPNAQTYLLAGEVFPSRIRGKGAGFAAAFAKTGAVATAVLFPGLLADVGTDVLMMVLIATSLAGALVTWRFRIETRRVNLENIGH
jgi:putative MFS transporter